MDKPGKSGSNVETTTHVATNSQFGLLIEKSTLNKLFGENSVQQILQKLTIRTEFKMGPPRTTLIYNILQINGRAYYQLPRNLALKMISSGIITPTSIVKKTPECAPIATPLECTLFPSQAAIVNYLVSDTGPMSPERRIMGLSHAVINVATGLGKTYIACGVIAAIGKRVLYISPNDYISRQAQRDMATYFDLPTMQYDKRGDKTSPQWDAQSDKIKKKYDLDTAFCVFVVINTAVKLDTRFFKSFGVVVLDEIHSYCSPEWSVIFWKINVESVLGMSATTDHRSDGLDILYKKHYGDVIHAKHIPGFNTDEVIWKGEVRAIKYNGSDDYTKEKYHPTLGELFTPAMIGQFAKDPHRLQLIVATVIKLLHESLDNNIFVFSETRDYLEVIYDCLQWALKPENIANYLTLDMHCVDNVATTRIIFEDEFDSSSNEQNHDVIHSEQTTVVPQIFDNSTIYAPELEQNKPSMSYLRGGISDADVIKAKLSRVILTTYGYSRQGVSIVKMNCAVFATPRRNGYIQICGRITRRGADTNIKRIIVDIIDNKTALRSQYFSRKISYDTIKFPVKSRTVSWELFDDLAKQAKDSGIINI